MGSDIEDAGIVTEAKNEEGLIEKLTPGLLVHVVKRQCQGVAK